MRSPKAISLAILLVALAVPPGPAWPQGPGRADSLIREAQKALQSEDYRAAQRYYEAAVAADRSSPEASCGLGQVYMALRQYEKAVAALRNCKKYILTALRKRQAEQARSQTSIDQEIRELRDAIQAIQSGRNKSAGADHLTRLEQRIRELETMKSRGQVEVALPPQVSFAFGTALLQVGRLDEAEGEFLDVIRGGVDTGGAHNNLATVYLAQGRWDEAAEQIRLAEEAGVRVNPQMKRDLEFRNRPSIATTPPLDATEPRREAGPVSIRHQRRTCAVRGHFVHVEAAIVPSIGVYDPMVRFRTSEAGGWYSTVMLPAGDDDFVAVLPRPRGASAFEYYIDVSTYDEKETRTDTFPVAVEGEADRCDEIDADSTEAASILIIDRPVDVANAPPVPEGFSIRGTTGDVGVLEMGEKKTLVYGGLALGAAIAGGLAIAAGEPEPYSGPQPFTEAPGIALVATDPPEGSTLSLSGGHVSFQLSIFSVEALPGARITAELPPSNFGGGCISLTTTQDLPARQATTVMISGPTTPAGGGCDTRVPLESLAVRVRNSSGLGGFQTGVPPLSHLRVFFHLAE